MRVAMIGTGYVGLVSGACFADFGHQVTCIDKDATKINQLKAGEIPIYEPGLDTLVHRNVSEDRLSFTTDIKAGIKNADAIFIAVGTPSRRGDGHADLSYVYAASEEISQYIQGFTTIITKSTVPVGTGDEIEAIIKKARPDALKSLYRPLFLNETPILFTNRRTSELIKYAANAFLATKITFINEMADLCEKVGANVQDISRGIGLDGRIGRKFLNAGPGYGGSCFPKDTLAIVQTAQDFGSPLHIIETVERVNKSRKISMAEKINTAFNGSVAGKRIAILGLAFKPNTDDMRDAPSLDIIPALQRKGAEISAFDPAAMSEAQKSLTDVDYGNF